jgi:hypothetical protein
VQRLLQPLPLLLLLLLLLGAALLLLAHRVISPLMVFAGSHSP